MAGEWRDATLGELTDFLSGGTPSTDCADYWTGAIPWVSAKDMKSFRLKDTEDHVTEEGIANGTRLAPTGSVLLLTRGMTLLNDLPICVINQPMTFNQDVKALRPKSGVREDFLPYLLLGNKERLLNLVDLAGHGTGRLNSDELKALDVGLPPEPEQRAIAHILGTLDDKIELNRRMSETLEAMARALFKAWFVDFEPVRAKHALSKVEGIEGRWQRGQSLPGLPAHLYDLFPDRLVDSSLGEIPDGWEVGTLGMLGELAIGGDWGEDEAFAGAVEASCLRGVDLEHLRQSGHASAPRRWFKPASLERRAMDERDVLVAGSGAGPTGRPLWMCADLMRSLGPCVYSNFCKRIRCGSAAKAVYLDAWLHGMRESGEIWKHVNGTSVPNLDANSLLARKEIPLPPVTVLDKYHDFVRLIWQELFVGQNRTLVVLRDTLLPKLIFGELRVTDAERFVEAVL